MTKETIGTLLTQISQPLHTHTISYAYTIDLAEAPALYLLIGMETTAYNLTLWIRLSASQRYFLH